MEKRKEKRMEKQRNWCCHSQSDECKRCALSEKRRTSEVSEKPRITEVRKKRRKKEQKGCSRSDQ
jgi:hypothetical protein